MPEVISYIAMALALGTLAAIWVLKRPMVFGLVLANVLVFLAILFATGGTGALPRSVASDLGAHVSDLVDGNWMRYHTFLTAAFLHADVLHLVGNMLILGLIGLPFEERVGRGRFLAIYVLSAVSAVLIHSGWTIASGATDEYGIPMVGASGAVFGILGAFAVLYPRDRVPLWLVFILLPRVPVYLAAITMVAIEWLLLQADPFGGVARAAHIGGAVGGVLFGLLLHKRRAFVRPKQIDYDALDGLAVEPGQKALLARVRENQGHGEIQRAWLEKFIQSAACRQCGGRFNRARAGVLRCQNGHEEPYAK